MEGIVLAAAGKVFDTTETELAIEYSFVLSRDVPGVRGVRTFQFVIPTPADYLTAQAAAFPKDEGILVIRAPGQVLNTEEVNIAHGSCVSTRDIPGGIRADNLEGIAVACSVISKADGDRFKEVPKAKVNGEDIGLIRP